VLGLGAEFTTKVSSFSVLTSHICFTWESLAHPRSMLANGLLST
jgi:hypothetical protein